MVNIQGDNTIKTNGITAEEFKSQLDKTNMSEKDKSDAMSIFNKYANADKDGVANVLDESEQVMARVEFAKMDKNDNDKVSKREFNHNSAGTQLNDISFKVYESFMSAVNNITSSAEQNQQGIVIIDNDNANATVIEGAATEDQGDDRVRRYNLEDGYIQNTTPDEDAPVQVVTDPVIEADPTDPPAPKKDFQNDAEVIKAVLQYLTNNDNLSDADIKNLQDIGALEGLTIETVTEEGADKVKITFNGEDFYLHKTDDGAISIDSEKPAEGEGKTLQKAILDSATTDTKHHYLNRYGKAGNTDTTYNSAEGVIENTSTNRQHVNPVQTFASMVLNNTEDSTLRFGSDNKLKGQDIIDVIKGEGSEEGITLQDLVKYLKAAVVEAQTTTDANKNIGTRTAASDVDMDLKDLTNLGIVFSQYAGEDNKLSASELDQLIKDLTSGKTMTGIAKEGSLHEYNEPKDKTIETPEPENPQDKPFEVIKDGPMDKNRTRDNAGENGGTVDYRYEHGRRTYVYNGEKISNANVAVYEDHGPLNMGKKDFLIIQGLEADVDAEVINPTGVDKDQVIRVEDKNGNVQFYNVTYNQSNKTYSLGTNKMLTNLFGSDVKPDMKVPADLTMEYSHGNYVYKLNGKTVNATVARAHILAENAKEAKAPVTAEQRQAIAEREKAEREAQLTEYLKTDTAYQEYQGEISRIQGEMATINQKYGIDPNDKMGIFRISDDGERATYQNNELILRIFEDDIVSYRNVMREWKDGHLGERSTFTRTINGVSKTYTNLERITLSNGQHAWKSNEGVFYPYVDGNIGGRRVPAELLKTE